METIKVGILGRDQAVIRFERSGDVIDSYSMEVVGCYDFLKKVSELKGALSKPLSSIDIPQGTDHSSMLIRELVLKLQGRWEFPYQDKELCHCRVIETEKVDQAILGGALQVASVSRKTSAGTGCGTCRKDISNIISYRKSIA